MSPALLCPGLHVSSFPPLNTLLHTNPKSPVLDACREGAVENQRASLLKTPFPGAEASLGPESYFLVPTITQNYQNYLNSRAGTPLQKSSSETPRRTGRAGKEGWRDGLRGAFSFLEPLAPDFSSPHKAPKLTSLSQATG